MKIIITFFLSILSILFLQFAPQQYIYNSNFNLSQIIFLILLNIISLYKFRRHGILSIFNVFMLNILITLSIPVFNPTIKISGIGAFYNPELFSTILQQFTAFYLVFFGSMILGIGKVPKRSFTDIIDYFSEKCDNIWVVYISTFVFLTFIFFGKVGRQSSDILLNLPIEYSFIFIFLIRIYGKNSMFNKVLIHVLLMLLMVKTLVYGGRIELIIAALILYIMFYEKKITYKLVTPIAVCGILIFEIIAMVRSILNMDYISFSNNRLSLLFKNTEQSFILSTEGDVIYSSMAMTGIVESGIVSFEERAELFFNFVLTQFIPIGNILQNTTLAHFVQEFTSIGGGGMIFSQFNFYFGNLGVIFCAILIFFIFRVVVYSKMNYGVLVALFSVILFPRWLLYFPDYLVKFPILYLYGLICFYVLNLLTKKRGVISKAYLERK